MVQRKNIAVVGSGISGLSAAWLLSQNHKVTLFEKNSYYGGHSNTEKLSLSEGLISVDTGFIVYNKESYPNLVALFDYFDVPTTPTDMSFALSYNKGAYEYSGSGFNGIFGQRRNLLKPSHFKMLSDIQRFFKQVAQDAMLPCYTGITLGAYLQEKGYSPAFQNHHIIPMAAAIWSASEQDTLDMEFSSFVEFFANHGLLKINNRPPWQTVKGGSIVYVKKLIKAIGQNQILSAEIEKITRQNGQVTLTDRSQNSYHFDDVVIATHADQALAMLGDEASTDERRLLGVFHYSSNEAVLHDDPKLMPLRKAVWASWNFLSSDKSTTQSPCLTYWMNSLQDLPTSRNIFVTLNPVSEIENHHIYGRYHYEHPQFNTQTRLAQKQLWSLQGKSNIWFCGSYFGYGFHEDGLQSGLAVAEQLGGAQRPWRVKNPSGRIFTAPLSSDIADNAVPFTEYSQVKNERVA